jgi:teichuronic acid biosynthesis glycosyltransferase TuaG
MEKKVSIIIPFYNRVDWLTEAVESVLGQTYKYYEIIVVNDGSIEDMSGFLLKFREKIIYIYKENGGPATARNLAIDMASGHYIAFLDSDDIWLPDKLEIQVNWMERMNAIWSHTCYSTFSNNINDSKFIDTTWFTGQVYPKILIKSSIATPCVMVRSDILKSNINLRFNNDMRYGQDMYFYLLFAHRNYKLEVIPFELSKVRLRGNNAALRAKAQLYAKANIWTIFKSEKYNYLKDERLFLLIKLIYWLCYIGNTIISWLAKRINLNEKNYEIIAKIFYALPYGMITIYRITHKKEFKKNVSK